MSPRAQQTGQGINEYSRKKRLVKLQTIPSGMIRRVFAQGAVFYKRSPTTRTWATIVCRSKHFVRFCRHKFTKQFRDYQTISKKII